MADAIGQIGMTEMISRNDWSCAGFSDTSLGARGRFFVMQASRNLDRKGHSRATKRIRFRPLAEIRGIRTTGLQIEKFGSIAEARRVNWRVPGENSELRSQQ
jgi:hypothetical protein